MMTALSTTVSEMTAALKKALSRVDLSETISSQATRIVSERFPDAEMSIVPVSRNSAEILVDRVADREVLR